MHGIQSKGDVSQVLRKAPVQGPLQRRVELEGVDESEGAEAVPEEVVSVGVPPVWDGAGHVVPREQVEVVRLTQEEQADEENTDVFDLCPLPHFGLLGDGPWVVQSFGASAQSQVGNEQTGHELGNVDCLPDITHDYGRPSRDHPRPGGHFAHGGAKGKQSHASAILGCDTPHGTEISRGGNIVVWPSSDMAERVGEVDHIEGKVDELAPQRLCPYTIRRITALVYPQPHQNQPNKTGACRAAVESDISSKGGRCQAIEEGFGFTLAHEDEKPISQDISRNDEEQGNHGGPVEYDVEEWLSSPVVATDVE